jgi:hypothetical protein
VVLLGACSGYLVSLMGPTWGYADPVTRQTPERMYEQTGMTQDQRDQLIYELWRKRLTYAKIARRVGLSIGGVQASLRRTAERMAGQRT